MDRSGEIKYNKVGLKMEIVEYNKNDDILVKFSDNSIKRTTYANFKNGSVTNRFNANIYGVGCIGNATSVETDGSIKKSYMCWHSMIERCYFSSKTNNPTYQECKVCEEWLCFENFEKWFDKNYYEVDGEPSCLDKDILVKSNKIYSPLTCVFVNRKINNLFCKSDKRRNGLPIGVYSNGRAFISNLGHSYLGTFKTKEEAFYCYKREKESHIKNIADEYKDKITEALYNALYNYNVEITD